MIPRIEIVYKENLEKVNTWKITTSDEAISYISEELSKKDRENSYILYLDTANHPISYEVLSIGNIKATSMSTFNIIKSCVLQNSQRIIVFHNHPSGDINPSTTDISLTKKLISALKKCEISLLDHIIVGGINGTSLSMRSFYPELF